MLSHIKITIIGIFSFLLVACDDSEYAALETGTIVNGTVVDGYIDNATVCLDINKNNICDDSEPTTNSDENGLFKFTNVILEESSFIPIIAYGGIDTATDKNFDGQLRTILDTSNISENSIVSPLTDLVTQSFLDTDMNSSDTLNNVKTEVANIFSIPRAEIEKDPMKDITLFIKTQELQHSKDMIQKVLEKNIQEDMNTLEKRLLQNNIKKELLEPEMDTERVLISLATNYNTSIPDNEESFAIQQLEEVSNALTAVSTSVDLNVESFSRLQKSIDIKQTEALIKLLDSNNSDVIELTTFEISTESITQTMFNESGDAILDTKACLKTDTSNILENSNANIMDDIVNGISLSSGYTQTAEPTDSLVTIFYPNIEVRLSDEDKQVIFKDNYYFIFNKAWLKNEDKMVYILTPKNGDTNSICYRFELNNELNNDTEGTKVYRYLN